jgi:hypothetical protein
MIISANTVQTVLEVKFQQYFQNNLRIGGVIKIESQLQDVETLPKWILEIPKFNSELKIESKSWRQVSDFESKVKIVTTQLEVTVINNRNLEQDLRFDKLVLEFSESSGLSYKLHLVNNSVKIRVKLI